MFNIINKLIFVFKLLYSLFKFIFFKGLMGTRLIYESSNKNACTLNDEFELINHAHESTVIASVENKNKTESLNENQFDAQKNEKQSIIETNIQSNDVSIVKSENSDIFEKSIFDLTSKDWDILYKEIMKYTTNELKNTDGIMDYS
ncbi:uncharacterized protein LOC114122711 [Aphis gossypii]|uniref:uncharacterized protein LOC114122711 n=1 Tax=Aphis gossypii TaxID=80765 RepID=UPI0021596AAC|nr:uncharacterized protein LOC114122711 [Aphis gossypii]